MELWFLRLRIRVQAEGTWRSHLTEAKQVWVCLVNAQLGASCHFLWKLVYTCRKIQTLIFFKKPEEKYFKCDIHHTLVLLWKWATVNVNMCRRQGRNTGKKHGADCNGCEGHTNGAIIIKYVHNYTLSVPWCLRLLMVGYYIMILGSLVKILV